MTGGQAMWPLYPANGVGLRVWRVWVFGGILEEYGDYLEDQKKPDPEPLRHVHHA